MAWCYSSQPAVRCNHKVVSPKTFSYLLNLLSFPCISPSGVSHKADGVSFDGGKIMVHIGWGSVCAKWLPDGWAE